MGGMSKRGVGGSLEMVACRARCWYERGWGTLAHGILDERIKGLVGF